MPFSIISGLLVGGGSACKADIQAFGDRALLPQHLVSLRPRKLEEARHPKNLNPKLDDLWQHKRDPQKDNQEVSNKQTSTSPPPNSQGPAFGGSTTPCLA